ncbi:selenoprotein H [Medicago truncatula]|uniref:selenoprotein H n=1 Tax=Medicago truncatula TaxID=3880 RepID=UPI000D2F3657|nr:selenoprotein H [Medicago truncatula]
MLGLSREGTSGADADPKGKGKQAAAPEGGDVSDAADEPEDEDDDPNRTVIVVEHYTQCKSFLRRATEVKDGLEGSQAIDVVVKLNPEKPRRGCFEIRQQGDQTFISLLVMGRPFKPMKDLDMDKIISDIVDGLSNIS